MPSTNLPAGVGASDAALGHHRVPLPTALEALPPAPAVETVDAGSHSGITATTAGQLDAPPWRQQQQQLEGGGGGGGGAQ
jgi:hypothetical protein